MHLIEINSLTESQIFDIYNLANELKENKTEKRLDGKTFALFFPESSLRTRITFEKGIKELGGTSILFPPDTLDKREKLEDVIKYLENWVDGLVIRHPDLAKIKTLASHATIPVINAMTAEDHPCEILSDLYSIAEIRKNYRDLTYTFVGVANNISRSWLQIAKVMNLTFRHACTSGNQFGEDSSHYYFTTNLESALRGSDVILTDSLPGEYMNEDYIKKYQITMERMQLANKGAILNPCPPFFRDEEVSTEVINSDYFVGYGFKKNLLHVQQAIILYCISREMI
jgi:ornithine carbamoyltransferase